MRSIDTFGRHPRKYADLPTAQDAAVPLGIWLERVTGRECHALARAAARVGCLALPALDVLRADAGVDVALAEPDAQLSQMTAHTSSPPRG